MTQASNKATIELETLTALTELRDQDLEAVTGGKDRNKNPQPPQPQ